MGIDVYIDILIVGLSGSVVKFIVMLFYGLIYLLDVIVVVVAVIAFLLLLLVPVFKLIDSVSPIVRVLDILFG